MSALRDYSAFDAELAGKAFDGRLLRRLLHWLRPHWRWAALSAVPRIVGKINSAPAARARIRLACLLAGMPSRPSHRHVRAITIRGPPDRVPANPGACQWAAPPVDSHRGLASWYAQAESTGATSA